MTVYELLSASQEGIRDPDDHCRHVFATDANGKECNAYSEEAKHFCGIGITQKIAEENKCWGTVRYAARLRLFEACSRLFPKRGFADVNDQEGHAAVMQVYDLARQIELDSLQPKETAV